MRWTGLTHKVRKPCGHQEAPSGAKKGDGHGRACESTRNGEGNRAGPAADPGIVVAGGEPSHRQVRPGRLPYRKLALIRPQESLLTEETGPDPGRQVSFPQSTASTNIDASHGRSKGAWML